MNLRCHHGIAVKREAGTFLNVDFEQLTRKSLRIAVENDHAVGAGAAGESLGVVAARTLAQDFESLTDQRQVLRLGNRVDLGEQVLVALFLDALGQLIRPFPLPAGPCASSSGR